MTEGILWFDNAGSLEERVRRAAARYQEKYGVKPTACQAPPADLPNGALTIDDIRVTPAGNVQPYHLWIGVA